MEKLIKVGSVSSVDRSVNRFKEAFKYQSLGPERHPLVVTELVKGKQGDSRIKFCERKRSSKSKGSPLKFFYLFTFKNSYLRTLKVTEVYLKTPRDGQEEMIKDQRIEEGKGRSRK